MDNTHEFVEKVHETQQKNEKNRKSGKGNPGSRLPGKQKSTNK
ncbi:DUF4023 family protein [Paenibacillus apiarius]|uniref:DUF4023 domain-containing protein n=1 Tax=Paenibacillus apiarius TaxID=46240 RepID=A0ABT4DQ48_9BACL|nr:DUF4023 family protein [Paenibacillus apiarius]MBN3524167.1 DUF4023 family protein [Paenibacillus apiarius]MCY9513954.1 DUF4023 domain-containing protein [Paenibacillus apiarius]MCY9519471.1 DUF4023 domain-containing protein [Paenibacillus apiarius]MCY9552398.1 DUF4023 domain-containing protein [Paenibacillus apiarius]MCY9556226.1 DUF4023 domain-containing protein [Paenibacillus apiarius]